jgi:hypothetical protein
MSYDPREKFCPPLDGPAKLQRENLEDAKRVVLGTTYRPTLCHDWPASDPMPTADPEE